MDLTFRTATAEDFEAIAALAEKIWREHYSSIISTEQIGYMLQKMYSAESLQQQAKEGHVFTLAFLDNVLAGYLSHSSADNKNYFIHKLYVDTGLQAKGLGTLLLERVLHALPQAQTLELTVNRQNFKAVNFYFRNGFVIKAVADFDIGNGFFMNDFIMQRKL